VTDTIPENPYERAKSVWNERYRSFVTAKRNWQILAVTALLSNAAQAGGMVWLASQSRVVPYIVRVDDVGKTVVLGPAQRTTVSDPKVIAWQLGDYLQRARQVTADRTAQKALLERVYGATKGAATITLNESFRERNPFLLMEHHTITASVESLLQLSPETWQADWTEIRRSIDGQTQSTERWTGQFTVAIEPPSTPEGLASNPLGFFVTHITWSRRL
jgi:type IV secretion system protein VirB5